MQHVLCLNACITADLCKMAEHETAWVEIYMCHKSAAAPTNDKGNRLCRQAMIAVELTLHTLRMLLGKMSMLSIESRRTALATLHTALR